MAFGDDDLRAMLSDFGGDVAINGTRVGVGTIDQTIVSADDGSGLGVQRRVTVLRVTAGALGEWKRDDLVTVDGVKYRLREKIDDARSIDGAWDLFSVGLA